MSYAPPLDALPGMKCVPNARDWWFGFCSVGLCGRGARSFTAFDGGLAVLKLLAKKARSHRILRSVSACLLVWRSRW